MLGQLRTAITKYVWVRGAVLFVLCVVIGIAFLPQEIRSSLVLRAVYYVGAPLSIAIVLGGGVGWLAYSKRAFLWTTGVLLLILLFVQVIRFGSNDGVQLAGKDPDTLNSRRSILSTVAEIKDSQQPTQEVNPQPQQNVQPVEVKLSPATARDWKACRGGDGEAMFVTDIVAACTRIIESKSAPNPSFIYAHRGSGYFALKDNDRAIQDLDEAIRLDPTFAWAFYMRSLVWEKMGEIQSAYLDSVKATAAESTYRARRDFLRQTYGLRGPGL